MDKKILLQNLAESLAERTGLTKRKAEAFVRSFFELTEEGLTADGLVKVKNYGTTKIINVNNRESVNINTGERFQIEGHAKVSFTPDAFFRDLVNRPFAHFTTIILDDNVDEEELKAITGEMPNATEELADDLTEDPAEDTADEEPLDSIDTTAGEAPAVPTQDNETKDAPQEATETISNETTVVNPADAKEEIPETPIEEKTEAPLEEPAEASEEGPIEEPLPDPIPEAPQDENETEEFPELHNNDGEVEEEIEMPRKQTSQYINTAETVGKSIIINNTIPTPNHNHWRTAFILLAMLILALVSYFLGYFRIFCPCNLFGTDAEELPPAVVAPAPVHIDSIMQAKADSTAKAKADSIAEAAKEAEAKQKAQEKALKEAARKEAAEKEAAAKRAKREEAEKEAAAKKAAARQAELQEAKKYPQLNGNYLITGVLRTRTIRPGENLYMIARQVYGHKGFARYISFHNGIEDPNIVTVGQRIQLPRLTRK